MGASFPIHLRADTSRDKIHLPPVTHGPSHLSNWALLGTTPGCNAKHQIRPYPLRSLAVGTRPATPAHAVRPTTRGGRWRREGEVRACRTRTSQPTTDRSDRVEPSRRPSANHPMESAFRVLIGASSRTARTHSSPVRS